MKKLLEAISFEGEPQQKPGDQVRGTDAPKPTAKFLGTPHKHPFDGKLVGEEVDEVEQIDELSPAAMQRYIKAANQSRANATTDAQQSGVYDPTVVDKMDNRAHSTIKAANKVYTAQKSTTESLEEALTKAYEDFVAKKKKEDRDLKAKKQKGAKSDDKEESLNEAGQETYDKKYGVKYKVFAGKEGRVTTKEYWAKTQAQLDKAVEKIENLDNFYEIDGYSYPPEAQVSESEGVAGAKKCWDGYKKSGTKPGTGKNAGKQVNNCVKEDGQINELNKDTIYSYRRKSEKDLDKQANILDYAMRARDPNLANTASKKVINRSRGIDRAEDRLGKSSRTLSEIGFADDLGNLSMPEADILSFATKDGTISQKPVMLFKKDNSELFFFADEGTITALVLTAGDNLKAIKNISGESGQVFALLNYIVNIKDKALKITADEPLTKDGFNWVAKLLKEPSGLKVTDLDKNPIDIVALKDEWKKSKSSRGIDSGGTGILISESSLKWKRKLKENESRLIPYVYFRLSEKSLNEANGENRAHYDRVRQKGVVPGINRDEYTDMSGEGLEGPFKMKSGRVVYYDPKSGQYYDRKTDMYLDDEELYAMNEEGLEEDTPITPVAQSKESLQTAKPVAGQPLTPSQQAPAPAGMATATSAPGQPTAPAAGQPGGAPVAPAAGQPGAPGSPPAPQGAANAATTPMTQTAQLVQSLANDPAGAKMAAMKLSSIK